MGLFDPGMSLLHRAGLGGLACSLKALERAQRAGTVRTEDLPAPFVNGKPPWEIDERSITLRFGQPDRAGEYLRKLFEFAFRIGQNGLIYLPGQFKAPVSAAVLADLQLGLLLTFLQHGLVRQLAKEPHTESYDSDGDGTPGVIVEFRKCSGFKHQKGWMELVDKNGQIAQKLLRVDGPICPGTVVRHVAYTSDTAAEDPPARLLPLYFALVGCLSLAVNRGVAALLVPEVENLREFVDDRPAMTPSTARDCQIANAADAALQAQIRLRARATTSEFIPGCYAMTFTPTAWASQQKSRVATIHVPPGDDRRLDRFERAWKALLPRIVTRTVKVTEGRGKQKTTREQVEAFRTDSIIRPMIAENLALGRPWYAGFVRLVTRINPATGKPYRDQLSYERKGLHDMIRDQEMWDTAGEATIVHAVHEALRSRYGQIADENKTNSTAMKNRFSGEYDRWRLAFAGAKSVDQFRKALCDLFSRAGNNSVLRKSWQEVLPMLRPNTWQHARDLALIGLCSYQRRDTSDDNSEE